LRSRQPPSLIVGRDILRSAAKLLTRRIAVNLAKVPELLRKDIEKQMC